jgi:hypothetical protein
MHYYRLTKTGTLEKRPQLRCTVPGCTRKHFGKGLCAMHWTRKVRYGDVNFVHRQRWNGQPCRVPACDKPIHAKGYCQIHLGRLRRNGDPQKALRDEYMLQHADICSVPGCGRPFRAKGLCVLHYNLQKPILKKAIARQKLVRLTFRGYIQTRAGELVRHMIFRRKLKRLPCEVCGTPKTHAHHHSYFPEHWLDVRWLCSKHHVEWHMHNKPIFPPITILPSLNVRNKRILALLQPEAPKASSEQTSA